MESLVCGCVLARARVPVARAKVPSSIRTFVITHGFLFSFVLEPRAAYATTRDTTHPRLTRTSANRRFKNQKIRSSSLSRQGSTRKKLAAASGALLEYVGRAAVMAGTRAERGRCWDYLTWLLKQRRGSRFTVPDLEKRDDCTELRIPRGAAGRGAGSGGSGGCTRVGCAAAGIG